MHPQVAPALRSPHGTGARGRPGPRKGCVFIASAHPCCVRVPLPACGVWVALGRVHRPPRAAPPQSRMHPTVGAAFSAEPRKPRPFCLLSHRPHPYRREEVGLLRGARSASRLPTETTRRPFGGLFLQGPPLNRKLPTRRVGVLRRVGSSAELVRGVHRWGGWWLLIYFGPIFEQSGSHCPGNRKLF